jgi:hypothetical protein
MTVIKDAPWPRGYMLVKSDAGRSMTVVRVDWERGQVYDAMPGDRPRDGGAWYARICGAGVRYVAGWYSPSYARRVWRRLTRNAE